MHIRRVGLAIASGATITALIIGAAAGAAAHNADGKPGGKGSPVASLVTAGTITKDQAISIRSALKEQRSQAKEQLQADRKATLNDVLSGLVSTGTLTQAQADALASTDKRGLRDLVEAGTVTREQLKAVAAGMREAREGSRDEKLAQMQAAQASVLAALVADGTLTQEQADAVGEALQSAQANRQANREGKGSRGIRGLA
mgnify:CR=1 FL=1